MARLAPSGIPQDLGFIYHIDDISRGELFWLLFGISRSWWRAESATNRGKTEDRGTRMSERLFHVAYLSPVGGELLFYAHFLRFCNLDTMNRARSGCPFSPLDCHYRSARWSWWRTVDRCRIRSRQTATPDRESFPETVT